MAKGEQTICDVVLGETAADLQFSAIEFKRATGRQRDQGIDQTAVSRVDVGGVEDAVCHGDVAIAFIQAQRPDRHGWRSGADLWRSRWAKCREGIATAAATTRAVGHVSDGDGKGL